MLNKTAGNRMISKQECVCLLLNRSLVGCSESIENISISKASRVTLQKSTESSSGHLQKYATRPPQFEEYSFHSYFHYLENEKKKLNKRVVPHYVGGYMNMTFPMKKEYATSMFQIYKPWREPIEVSPANCEAFDAFIHSHHCPKHLRMSYIRSIRKYTNPESSRESVSSNHPHNQTTDNATQEFIDLMSKHDINGTGNECDYNFDFGVGHDWTQSVDPNVS